MKLTDSIYSFYDRSLEEKVFEFKQIKFKYYKHLKTSLKKKFAPNDQKKRL